MLKKLDSKYNSKGIILKPVIIEEQYYNLHHPQTRKSNPQTCVISTCNGVEFKRLMVPKYPKLMPGCVVI